MREQLKPLHLTDPSLLRETRLEKCCHFVPLLGWTFAYFIQCGRIGRAVEDVHEQLATRGSFPVAAWGSDAGRTKRAMKISEIVKCVLELPNAHFLPDDPWHLLVLEDEGFGHFEVTYELEKQCGLTLDLDTKILGTADYFSLRLSDIVDSVRPDTFATQQRTSR